MKKKIFIEQLPHFFKTNPEFSKQFEYKGYEVVLCESGSSCKEIDRGISNSDACILCIEKMDERRIQLAPNLRIIATCGAGTDHIDVAYATSVGIPVCNAAGQNAVSVAEMTFAHMLGLARRVQVADRFMRQGEWRSFVGDELHGKVWGIVGTGKVGIQVAKIANSGFGMRVIGYDIIRNQDLVSMYGLEYVDLEELFERSDYISIHMPLLKETKNCIEMNLFKLMKKTAFLVNVSRGGVVNEEDMYQALEKQMFAGIGMDVYKNEPLPSQRYMEFDSVINTTHMAGNTRDSIMRIGLSVSQNVHAVLEGNMPIDNVVNPEYLQFKRFHGGR